MNRIIFFPVGSSQAIQHYKATVKEGYSIKKLEKYLDEDNLSKIYLEGETQVAVWGLGRTKRQNTIWENINRNNLAMFVQGKEVISYAMVLLKINSPTLSEELWGNNQWSNILIFTKVETEKCPISFDKIIESLEYKSNFVLQGTIRASEEKSEAILNEFSDVANKRDCWLEMIKAQDEKKKATLEKRTEERDAKESEKNYNPKIFISYAHEDEAYKDRLKKHLSILFRYRKAGYIWDDRLLEAGEDYNKQIKNQIMESNICIMLISADYLDSAYCMEELNFIIGQDKMIVPIIVRACYWKKLFSYELSIITFPNNNGNIYASKDQDYEFAKIVEYIDKRIQAKIEGTD